MNTQRLDSTGATTRYYGPTETRGSRIRVTINGDSKFADYDYAAPNAHVSAVEEIALMLDYASVTNVRFVADSESGRGCVYLFDYLTV